MYNFAEVSKAVGLSYEVANRIRTEMFLLNQSMLTDDFEATVRCHKKVRESYREFSAKMDEMDRIISQYSR
jgi:hypothetical protein